VGDKRFHHRRLALGLALGAPLLSPLAAWGQTDKPRRIGVLYPLPRGGPNNMAVFFDGLKELGYVEGRNLVVERRFSDGNDAQLPALAADLVKQNVELIVAAGPPATFAAKAATSTVPIVMGVADPVQHGLIASLAKPGGNMTGWCILTAEGVQKQLALLKEAMPRVSRVGVVTTPSGVAELQRTPEFRRSVQPLGLELVTVEVAGPEGLEQAFATMRRERVDAHVVLPEPRMDQMRDKLAELAARQRLPGIYMWRFYADAGGLMSYGPNLRSLIALWPSYVDKILKGVPPGDIPVQTPTRYELVLNHRAGKAMGFTFPGPLVLAADAVIN
jgi:putative ABC transport system substrate-binding protein